MSRGLEILAVLEPHASEIVSVVNREQGIKPERYASWLGKDQVYADYLARVDGDDYVVSVGDARMKPDDVDRDLRVAAEYDMYATDGDIARKWIGHNKRLLCVTARLRPLFQGHVSVVSRDAYDTYDRHDELLARGMIGYTLRRGSSAILHETGTMPDDPDFFLRAVQAVNPANQIDQKTHFTATEEQKHAEIHRPIIDRMDYLIERDGLSPTDAFQRYAEQHDETDDISTEIASLLQIGAQFEPVAKNQVRYAAYRMRKGEHLLITKHGDKKQYSFTVVHERVVDGEAVKRTFEQPWNFPNMLLADVPPKKQVVGGVHDKRLFALSNSDALELNALLASLQNL